MACGKLFAKKILTCGLVSPTFAFVIHTTTQIKGHSLVVAAIRKETEKSSLRAVAKRTGIDPSVLSKVLSGRRGASEAIAAAFGFERQVITTVVFRKAA